MTKPEGNETAFGLLVFKGVQLCTVRDLFVKFIQNACKCSEFVVS